MLSGDEYFGKRKIRVGEMGGTVGVGIAVLNRVDFIEKVVF